LYLLTRYQYPLYNYFIIPNPEIIHSNNGLLDAPAVVGTDVLLMNEGPVFLPESEGGIMLTTENPNYFRKDLPAYIPQLFVLSWSWGTKKWETDFRKAIEEKFPIEKLQAMIDK
jgi:hypothetical protein